MPDSTPSTVNGYDMELAGNPTLADHDGGNFRLLSPPQAFESGGFLGLDGTDDCGTIAELLDEPPAAGAVALWFRPDAVAAAGEFLFSKASEHSAGTITEGLTLGFTNSGKSLVATLVSGGSSHVAQLELGGVWGSDATAGAIWHHVVVSWGTKLRLWVNGECVAEAAHVGAWADGADAPFAVGAKYLAAASGFCEVSVDEIEIRNSEPTLTEVQTWANRGALPQTFELDRWDRNALNPLLSPTVTEEDNTVFEPQLARLGPNDYVGVYTGGTDEARIFGMTSTDGKVLTKTGIVMGHGVGGQAGDACRPFILNDDGDLYLFFTDEIGTTGGSIHYATTDDDGATWEEQGTVIDPDAVRTGYANASVAKIGATYHWLIEHVKAGEGQAYFVSYFTSASPAGPLTLVDGVTPNETLRQGLGSTSSRLMRIGNEFHLFMHAGRYSNIPTAVYHAVSEDCRRWDVRAGAYPVVPLQDFSIMPRQDQSADACVYEMPESGEVGMLYDIDDNHGGGLVARICGTTFEGTLEDLTVEYPSLRLGPA